MNTWKQKSRLTQANLTSEPSANMAQEQSPMVRYLQEAAAGEQSCTLDLDKQMRSRMERQFGAPAGALIEKLERQSGVGLDNVEIHRDSPPGPLRSALWPTPMALRSTWAQGKRGIWATSLPTWFSKSRGWCGPPARWTACR